jgi:hypothetical protein
MYKVIAASFLCLFSTNAFAQDGCTDVHAMNYNPTARKNDGTCTYATIHYEPILKAVLPATIPETSGLVWDDGKLWTLNDSGNPAELFSIDSADGHILQTVYIDNFPNIDWEDLTADKDYIYIGDFGNNRGRRTDQKILKIAKNDIGKDALVHVKAKAISFNYADQTNFEVKAYQHNFDCEAIISIKDELYIFTKNWSDLHTKVYKLPKEPGNYTVKPYDIFNVAGVVTAASYNKETKEIVLLGYIDFMKHSFMWFLNDYTDDHFFTGNKRRIDMGDGKAWQTEGISFISPNHFLISNEKEDGKPAALYSGWLDSFAHKQ